MPRRARPTCSASSSTRSAGLSAAKKISAIAEASGILMNCGGLAALVRWKRPRRRISARRRPPSVRFGAAEFAFGVGAMGPDPLTQDIGFRCKDGKVTVPTGPGLGLTLDEAVLDKLTLQKHVVDKKK